MISKKRYVMALMLVLSGIAGLGLIYRPDPLFLIKKNFTIFSEVYSEVSEGYVVEVDPEKLMRHGIRSMLETLDPYTVLIEESQIPEIEIMSRGGYAGVGIEVGSRGGRLVVIAPIEGYSAHRKGIKAGDVILEVNGMTVESLSADELQLQMRGDTGTTVEIMIERFGLDTPLLFELTRERIEVRNISSYGIIDEAQRIGYIHLTRFGQNTAEEVRNAINDMRSGGGLNSLVLDLRNNPGGLLFEAVKTVDKFVGPGIGVVTTRGRAIESRTVFSTEEAPLFGDEPLVVLINNGSASASEIVAGALQDLDRAVIIGERSFGKGLVQIVKPLSYNLALKITTSKYYIPSGRSIQTVDYDGSNAYDQPDREFSTRAGRSVYQHNGIDPDLHLEAEPQSMLEIALQQQNHYFFFANEYAANHDSFDAVSDSESAYSEFRSYIERVEFTYTNQPERYFAQLEESLLEQPSGIEGDLLDQLRTQIVAAKSGEMNAFKDRIMKDMVTELTGRFEDSANRLMSLKTYDDGMSLALRILEDQQRYRSVLSP
ncbi:MAG: S41 family peptidase [Rhodothermaceae bacterium]|nr:S41 family peptidase [Rhodothermaceae bacterium]